MKHSTRAIVFAGTFFMLLGGCTNQAMYQSIQVNRANECLKLPIPARDECLAQHSLSYADYVRLTTELEQSKP